MRDRSCIREFNNRLYRHRHAAAVRELPSGYGRRTTGWGKYDTCNVPATQVQHGLVEVKSARPVVVVVTTTQRQRFSNSIVRDDA